MLTKLLPEQISKFWPVIKYAVEESLPPTAKGEHLDKMNRILSGMLSGKLDVWVSYIRLEDNTVKFNGVVVTQIIYDEASHIYNLLLYAVYAYDSLTDETWMSGYETLANYAKLNKCTNIIAYSSVPRIISVARKLGADTSFTFISFPLKSVL